MKRRNFIKSILAAVPLASTIPAKLTKPPIGLPEISDEQLRSIESERPNGYCILDDHGRVVAVAYLEPMDFSTEWKSI